VNAAAAALTSAGAQRHARLGELAEWLAIPSVSAEPGRAAAVRAAGRWLGRRMARMGARVDDLPTGAGPPVVVGRFGGTSRPVVLIYGHYDVQPAGAGWTVHPFRPVVRNGVLYGRGANDDKGQLFAHLAALAAWQSVGGPPATVVVAAEGAEEIGSPGFAAAAAALRRAIGAVDLILVSDTERAGPGRPAVTISQRGKVTLRLSVDAGGPALHPGRYGGAVVDPSLVLGRALAAVEGAVSSWPARPHRRLPFPVSRAGDAEVRRRAGGRAVAAGNLHQRITLRPALTVTRLRAGDSPGAGPARAQARIDLRLPPGAEPAAVVERLRRSLDRVGPPAVRVCLDVDAAHRGEDLVPSAGVRKAVEFATGVGFGCRPAYFRSGGSIPAVGMLKRAFRTVPTLLGLGTPGGNAHGPDEHMDLPGWFDGIETSVALIAAMGGPAL